MKKTKLFLTKVFTFSASHRLHNEKLTETANKQLFGECYNLHGHNYKLEVTVQGNINQESGMIINFQTLKEIVNTSVVSKLDHKDLNTVPELKGKIPTAENIVTLIYELLSETELELARLRLWETDGSSIEVLVS